MPCRKKKTPIEFPQLNVRGLNTPSIVTYECLQSQVDFFLTQ